MQYLIPLLTLLMIPLSGFSQVYGPLSDSVDPFNTIRQNGVSTIVAFGDTVWISPSLNRNIGNAADWYNPATASKVQDDIGRAFSIALGSDTVFAGLGFSSETADGSFPAAYGYYRSTDGGDQWDYLPFPLDAQGSDDTTFTYGGKVYDRIRITVPEQSPPYAVDFKDDVAFSANWASGLLRSTDLGSNWERVVLPPAGARNLSPDEDYYWTTCLNQGSNGSCSESVNKYNSIQDNNLKGFGLLIDSQNRVWFGSAGGLNISTDALTAPIDSISWKHISVNNNANALLGDWIISIKEDPATGRIWMTNWIAETGQQEGIIYTDDGGLSFTQLLEGERINDIGFKDGYVFAAGDDGLFISPNGGDTWIKSPQIKSPNTFLKPSAAFYSVTSTTNRVWVGTEDGIASTGDYGQNWEITRVNFPLQGGNVFDEQGRDSKTYAYPNPFSPTIHELVRIKFEVNQLQQVKIRVFDFGMNLVREIENDSFSPGTYEAIWDGVDGKGRKVANGPYIYVIEQNDSKISGKILVVD